VASRELGPESEPPGPDHLADELAGAHKAIELGLQPAPAILLGAITAVGGGTLRDVLVGDGAVLCFAIRMVGVHFDLNVPARDPRAAPTEE
jgi:uncharacterized membrane protein YeiH